MFLPGGVLRIDKYDDRLVLRNPGTLRLPIEKKYDGGTSRARNPRIQNMLRMIGYGERKEAGWGDPVLENKVELDEVELALPVPIPNIASHVDNYGDTSPTSPLE